MKLFYYANVIDNNDVELQAGRVKIKIMHLHEQVDDDLLPWAKQMTMFSGGSGSYGKSCIPEIGSFVWVIFDNEDDFLKPFYIADVQLDSMNPHGLFSSNVAPHITGFSSVYPDVKYDYYANGVCIGTSSNSSTPEIFIYHPTGSYFFIDKNGNIKIKGLEIDFNGNSKSFVTYDALNTALQSMVTAANALFLTGASGAVKTGGLTLDISASKTTTVKTG